MSLTTIDENMQKELTNPDKTASFFKTYYKDSNASDCLRGSKDEFLTDLSSIHDKTLVLLHELTDWDAPAYYLRKRVTDYAQLSDEQLFTLVQVNGKKAIEEMINRYKGNLANSTDETLVLLIQHGYLEARDVLTKRFTSFVKRIVSKYRNSLKSKGYDFDDLYQEGTIGLFNAINDYKFSKRICFKDFSKYVIDRCIRTISHRSKNNRNHSLNKSFSYHTPIGSDSDLTFEQMLQSDQILPEQALLNNETLDDIVENLTLLERKVLYYYDLGYAYDEIADKTGKKKKDVDNTIQRYRNKGKRYRIMNLK